MEYCQRPKIRVLQGTSAIEALKRYVEELEENTPEELTEAQTEAMIKLTKGLISAIQDETTVLDTVRQSRLLGRVKGAIKNVSQIFPEPAEPFLREPPVSNHVPSTSPPNHR